MDSDRVVVGLDSVSSDSPALHWAAREAWLRRSELLIVHAVDLRETAPTGQPQAADAGRRILADASALIAARWPELRARTLLADVAPTEALVEVSGDAELLVLGNNGYRDLGVSMLGTVGHRVAAHSRCPVVVVPALLSAAAAAVPERVTVGLAATRAGRLALAAAFAQARLHGYPVTGIRVTSGSEPVADGDSLDPLVAPPDIAFDLLERTGEAVEVLLSAGQRSALLVLGCQHSDEPWSARLGSVPAALLGRLSCPLMLVGQSC